MTPDVTEYSLFFLVGAPGIYNSLYKLALLKQLMKKNTRKLNTTNIMPNTSYFRDFPITVTLPSFVRLKTIQWFLTAEILLFSATFGKLHNTKHVFTCSPKKTKVSWLTFTHLLRSRVTDQTSY